MDTQREIKWRLFLSGGVPAVLIGFLFTPVLIAGGTEKASRSRRTPPSFKKMIQNVRPSREALSQVVARVHVTEETGDGGGRLRWKNGQFVHRTNYRLGASGQLFLYQTVANQSETAFTFDLLTAPGRSFTYALKQRYRSPGRGDGLMDYALHDFSVRKRRNLRYAGYLMELNLFPRRLMAHRTSYRRFYQTRDGTTYLVLKRRVILRRNFYFTEILFLNTSTWRFERVVIEESRRRRVLDVQSFQQVHGVLLPKRVRVTSPGYTASLPFSITHDVSTNNKVQQSVREPSWMSDPALPNISETGTMRIHQQLRRGNVTAELYEDLMMAAIRYRYILDSSSHFHLDAFETSVRKARDRWPDSDLLRAFYDGAVTGKRLPDRRKGGSSSGRGANDENEKMYITSFRSIQSRPTWPFLNYAAAYRSSVNRNLERMNSYLEPVRDRFPFDRAARRLNVLNRLWRVQRRADLKEVLRRHFTGSTLRGRTGLIPPLQRLLKSKKNLVPVLRTSAEKHGSPLLLLALARYHQIQEQYDQANAIYRTLDRQAPDSFIVRNYILAYISSAGFQARPLIERYSERLPFVWVLIELAARAGQKNDPERLRSLTERILERLKNPENRVVGDYEYGKKTENNLTHLTELGKALNRQGQTDRFLKLVLRLTSHYPGDWTAEPLVDVLQSAVKERESDRFRVATLYLRLGRTEPISAFMDVKTLKDRLYERLDRKPNEIRLYTALARAITGGFIRKPERIERSISILRAGRKRFEEDRDRPHLTHAIADAYYLMGSHERAREVYTSLLENVVKTHNPKFYPHIFGPASWRSVRNASFGRPPSFQLSQPVLVKLAHCIKKTEADKGNPLQKLFRQARYARQGGTPALAFLIAGREEAALRYTLNQFKYTNRKEQVKPVLDALVGMLKQKEQYARAALVYDVAIRGKEVDDPIYKKEYRQIRKKIDRKRLIKQLRNRDYPVPSDQTRRTVRKHVRNIRETSSKKERMTAVTHLLNMSKNPIPVLLEYRDARNETVRKTVRKVLETFRMRELYQDLFGSGQSARTPRGSSGD